MWATTCWNSASGRWCCAARLCATSTARRSTPPVGGELKPSVRQPSAGAVAAALLSLVEPAPAVAVVERSRSGRHTTVQSAPSCSWAAATSSSRWRLGGPANEWQRRRVSSVAGQGTGQMNWVLAMPAAQASCAGAACLAAAPGQQVALQQLGPVLRQHRARQRRGRTVQRAGGRPRRQQVAGTAQHLHAHAVHGHAQCGVHGGGQQVAVGGGRLQLQRRNERGRRRRGLDVARGHGLGSSGLGSSDLSPKPS